MAIKIQRSDYTFPLEIVFRLTFGLEIWIKNIFIFFIAYRVDWAKKNTTATAISKDN